MKQLDFGFLPEETSLFASGWKKLGKIEETRRNGRNGKIREIGYNIGLNYCFVSASHHCIEPYCLV